MATNKFLIFNSTASNMMSDSSYSANAQRTGGLISGIASAVLHNKLFRQLSIMVAAIGELIKGQGVDASDTDFETLIYSLNAMLNGAGLSTYSSNMDGNGIYTQVDFKRADGTLMLRSTLSNLSGNNYLTDTWQFYNSSGVAIGGAKVWTLTYDSNGNISSKVVS